jgi:hypothetical protein
VIIIAFSAGASPAIVTDVNIENTQTTLETSAFKDGILSKVSGHLHHMMASSVVVMEYASH